MRTLLLADDSITVQRVIGLTFAAEDFEIVTVSDGQAAIDRIKTRPPDIVLAGSAMPNVSGYDVASFVRSQPALKHLPVLLLTGAFESVDLDRLKTSGVTGVLEKPLDPTVVISRVKNLLGIKGDAPPEPPGRRVTPATSPAARKPPVPRDAPASSQSRRSEPPAVRAAKPANPDKRPPSPDAPAEEGADGSSADYLGTLDAAFDSLDKKLDGRDEQPRYTGPERRASPPRHDRDGRNPAPPLAHQGTVVDPRLPDRRQPPPALREATTDSAIFEVDDEWFADDKQGQEESLAEQKVLAAEMGIRDMETPDGSGAVEAAAPNASATNADLDFEFGPDGEPTPAPAPPPPPAPPASQVADDFAALLAFEQGEQPHPPAASAPAPAPVIVQAAAPEITDDMLDQIAERVAVRLNAGSLGEHLRAEITATIRETVHAVVSETSERLVRDEIGRIKAQAERDTH